MNSPPRYGTVVLGPLRLAKKAPIPAAGTPISHAFRSRAFRRLGVTKGDYHDEFDAVGLGWAWPTPRYGGLASIRELIKTRRPGSAPRKLGLIFKSLADRLTISRVKPSAAGPPDAVPAAFGVLGDPAVLPGGKGGTWRVGQVVLKPVEFLAETLWRAEVLTRLPDSTEFRVARPVRTVDGAWVAQGWEACQLVAGEPDVRRQDEVLRAGIAFHAAIADLSRPAFLDLRDDPWAYGDRVAWEELPVHGCPAALELLAPLIRSRRPVDLASQVVHGDLPGNVLFAAGLPPAIIDWPAYWRPASWALAVVVADALCWYGAPPDLAARWLHLPAWGQMLVRALIYRIATHEEAFGPTGWTSDQVEAYQPAVNLAVTYADHRRN